MLWQDAEPDSKVGLVALNKYFVEEQGFSEELTRTLITKYPHILSKTIDHIEQVFNTLAEKANINRAESMKLIFECPKLLSIDLEKSMDAVFYIFDLYH